MSCSNTNPIPSFGSSHQADLLCMPLEKNIRKKREKMKEREGNEGRENEKMEKKRVMVC